MSETGGEREEKRVRGRKKQKKWKRGGREGGREGFAWRPSSISADKITLRFNAQTPHKAPARSWPGVTVPVQSFPAAATPIKYTRFFNPSCMFCFTFSYTYFSVMFWHEHHARPPSCPAPGTLQGSAAECLTRQTALRACSRRLTSAGSALRKLRPRCPRPRPAFAGGAARAVLWRRGDVTSGPRAGEAVVPARRSRVPVRARPGGDGTGQGERRRRLPAWQGSGDGARGRAAAGGAAPTHLLPLLLCRLCPRLRCPSRRGVPATVVAPGHRPRG